MVLRQVKRCQGIEGYYCLTSMDLNLEGDIDEELDKFVATLLHVGIFLSNQDDILVWNKKKGNGFVSAKLACNVIMEDGFEDSSKWWTKALWK